MGFDTIIALDLGKFKSVACLMDVGSRRHRFETLDTTPQRLHALFVANTPEDPSCTLVVVECCDAAGWVHDLAVSLGLAVKVANCRHEAWRWNKVKRKTDRDDALKLAKMTLNDELPTVHMPAPHKRQKRRLILHRRSLVARRTQCKNAIRSIFSQQGLSEQLPRGSKAWTKAGIEQLAADARPLDQCTLDELWRGRLHLELQLLDVLHRQILTTERARARRAGPGRCAGQTARDRARRRHAPGRDGGQLPRRPVPLQERRPRRQLRRPGAQADGERHDEAHRPHHAPRLDALARDARRSRMDGLAAQRLGKIVRRADQPWDEAAEEDRHRRAGEETAGDPLGHAARQHPLARRINDLAAVTPRVGHGHIKHASHDNGVTEHERPSEAEASAKCQGQATSINPLRHSLSG